MDILNTKNSFLFLFIFFSIFSCKKHSECLALYHFDKKIIFTNYSSKEVSLAKVFYKNERKTISGKISLNKETESLTVSGRIHFESITDSICKNDTIILEISNRNYLITDVKERHLKVSSGNAKPSIIEFKIDGALFRENATINKSL